MGCGRTQTWELRPQILCELAKFLLCDSLPHLQNGSSPGGVLVGLLERLNQCLLHTKNSKKKMVVSILIRVFPDNGYLLSVLEHTQTRGFWGAMMSPEGVRGAGVGRYPWS